ncbi:unnamed protein product [Trichobilharzia szidati]|nr:unnamed protein product [Trichobilharzia szidati]
MNKLNNSNNNNSNANTLLTNHPGISNTSVNPVDRSILVDLLCCTCCTNSDDEDEAYSNLIENHRLARIVTMGAILTILGLIFAYIIRSATETQTPLTNSQTLTSPTSSVTTTSTTGNSNPLNNSMFRQTTDLTVNQNLLKLSENFSNLIDLGDEIGLDQIFEGSSSSLIHVNNSSVSSINNNNSNNNTVEYSSHNAPSYSSLSNNSSTPSLLILSPSSSSVSNFTPPSYSSQLGVKLPFSALDSQIRAKPPPSVRIPPPPPAPAPPQPIPPSSLYQHQSHQHHDKHQHLQHQPHLSSLSSISASSPSPQSPPPPPPPQRQHQQQQKPQLKSTKEERSSCSSPSMLSIHEVEIVANKYTDLKYSNHSSCTSPINNQRCVVQNLSKTDGQNTSSPTVINSSMETKYYNNNDNDPAVPTISNNATTSTTTTTAMTTSNTPLTELIIVNEVASRSAKPRVAFIEPADEASIHDSNPTTTTITTNNNNQSDSESTVQINKENHPTTTTNKLKLSLSARFPDDDDDVRGGGGGGDNQQNVKTAQNDNVSVSAETLICSTAQQLTSSNPNRNTENRNRQIINKKVTSNDFNVNTAHTPPATTNNNNDMYSKTTNNTGEHNNIEERRHREVVDSEQEEDADEDNDEVMKPKASLYANPEISLSQLMNMNDEELYYELHEKYQNKRQQQQPSTSQLLTSQKLNEHKQQQQLQQPQRTSSILSQPRKSLAMIFSQISNNLGFTQESTTTGGVGGGTGAIDHYPMNPIKKNRNNDNTINNNNEFSSDQRKSLIYNDSNEMSIRNSDSSQRLIERNILNTFMSNTSHQGQGRHSGSISSNVHMNKLNNNNNSNANTLLTNHPGISNTSVNPVDRSILVDLLCCTCCTNSDDEDEAYSNLIENHRLARIVTMGAILTILGLIFAYIIRSATETQTPLTNSQTLTSPTTSTQQQQEIRIL